MVVVATAVVVVVLAAVVVVVVVHARGGGKDGAGDNGMNGSMRREDCSSAFGCRPVSEESVKLGYCMVVVAVAVVVVECGGAIVHKKKQKLINQCPDHRRRRKVA